MIKHLITISIPLLLASGCTTFQATPEPEKLLGVWLTNHEPNKFDYSITEYLPDHKKCEVQFKWTSAQTIERVLLLNTWRVEDDIIYTILQATDGSIEIGFPANNRILHSSKSSFSTTIVNYPGEWKAQVHSKIHGAKPGQICNIVKQALTTSKVKSNGFVF